jgi:hypothetical protein
MLATAAAASVRSLFIRFLIFFLFVALIGSVASSNLIRTQAIKPHRSPNFVCVSLHCFLGQLLNEKNSNKKQKG